MSTTTGRAFSRAPITLAVALIAAFAMTAFAPAPRAEAQPTHESQIVKIAASKKGAPYAYGATGPNSFDCSGFTSWVYARAGKQLPRTSSQQAAATRNVTASERRPGDLVFFASGGDVYHVGIYAGKGHIWHAPRPGTSVHLAKIWTPAHFYGRL